MRMFAFDPADQREHYREHGWVHIRDGLTPEFHGALREFVERRAREARVEGVAVYGEKRQALFEFPPETDIPGELFDAVCGVTGLHRPTMTLSERHIKAYAADANPEPHAHKDRFASQVSVGLSIDIPAESQLVLYPFDDVNVNPFNTSAAYRKSLDPDEQPERRLAGAREVAIDDAGGDIVMFPGHSVWHLRRRSAGAVNLYLKFNDFNSDPLGEDPTTAERRERTLALLEDGDPVSAVPVLGRRMDSLLRHQTRNGASELLQVVVWEDEPIPIAVSDAQFRLLRAVDSSRDVDSLADELGADVSDVAADVRRLALRAALDLVEE